MPYKNKEILALFHHRLHILFSLFHQLQVTVIHIECNHLWLDIFLEKSYIIADPGFSGDQLHLL